MEKLETFSLYTNWAGTVYCVNSNGKFLLFRSVKSFTRTKWWPKYASHGEFKIVPDQLVVWRS